MGLPSYPVPAPAFPKGSRGPLKPPCIAKPVQMASSSMNVHLLCAPTMALWATSCPSPHGNPCSILTSSLVSFWSIHLPTHPMLRKAALLWAPISSYSHLWNITFLLSPVTELTEYLFCCSYCLGGGNYRYSSFSIGAYILVEKKDNKHAYKMMTCSTMMKVCRGLSCLTFSAPCDSESRY